MSVVSDRCVRQYQAQFTYCLLCLFQQLVNIHLGKLDHHVLQNATDIKSQLHPNSQPQERQQDLKKPPRFLLAFEPIINSLLILIMLNRLSGVWDLHVHEYVEFGHLVSHVPAVGTGTCCPVEYACP